MSCARSSPTRAASGISVACCKKCERAERVLDACPEYRGRVQGSVPVVFEALTLDDLVAMRELGEFDLVPEMSVLDDCPGGLGPDFDVLEPRGIPGVTDPRQPFPPLIPER